MAATRVRRAAVLGSPVAHSLSPALHRAAFAALDLVGWCYDTVECDAAALAGFVDGLGPEWVGLSVTMPAKRAALDRADERTERAVAVGAANTLVRLPDGGWRADCTDVDGVGGALREAGWTAPPGGGRALVLGSGATSAAALAGLAALGVLRIDLVARDPLRATDAVACGQRLGLDVTVLRWAGVDLKGLAAGSDVAVSTVPAAAVDDAAARAIALAPLVLDVVYHPWPTVLAVAVATRGGRLATGLDMLLHQAFGQVEQFTGHPAPREAMRAALPTLERPVP